MHQLVTLDLMCSAGSKYKNKKPYGSNIVDPGS